MSEDTTILLLYRLWINSYSKHEVFVPEAVVRLTGIPYA